MDRLGPARLGRSSLRRGGLYIVLLSGLIFGLSPEAARAICDVIPGVTAEFRGALGTLSRPFAIPGDVGQQLSVTLDPSQCDGASPGFLNLPGGTLPEDDYFVTVLFEPPNAGTRNAVVLTTLDNLGTCGTSVTSALPQLGGGTATCRVVQPGTQELRVVNPTTLEVRFPDTDAELAPDDDDRTYTGPATITVTPVSAALPFGLATARCASTPGLVACIDELYTKNGTCGTTPANVDPVFGSFTALPPANDYAALCTTVGTECTGSIAELHFTVDAAGNALVPVDWRGILLRPDGIPVPRLVRGATSLEAFSGGGPVEIPGRSFVASYAPSGRRLPPIFEPLVAPSTPLDLTLFGSVDAPVGVMRIARRMPDLTNLTPVYRECAAGANDGLPCVVAEDCPQGTCGATTCRLDGVDTGQGCTDDLDCSAGQECGPTLFDFTDRLNAGVGPVLVPSTDYALDAENPVPIEGLLETPEMFAFVQLEAIAGSTAGGPTPQDLNGDGDTTDAVLVLRDRRTGTITPIGTATNPGRAATRVHEPPFSAPALAVEGDVAAFLESEPLEAYTDVNGDDDVFDSILRVYRMADCSGSPCALALDTDDLAVDADPIVEGRSVAVANGRVYFRASEAQNASQTTTRITSTPVTFNPNGRGSYSGGLADAGRRITFNSHADMIPGVTGCGADDALLCFGGTNQGAPCTSDAQCTGQGGFCGSGFADAYELDRDSDGDGVFDDPSPTFTRLSVRTDGCQGAPTFEIDNRSEGGCSTPDCRFVGMNGTADLDPSVPSIDGAGQWQEASDAYIRDRDVDQDGIFDEPGQVETRTVGLATSGVEGNHSTNGADLTPDGRFLLLTGFSSNLISPPEGEFDQDVFVRDLVTETTERVGVVHDSCTIDGHVTGGQITDDGRFVVFFTQVQAAPEDIDTATDVYLRDRDLDEDGIFDECSQPGATATILVNLAPPEENPNLKETFGGDLAGAGSVISFMSDSTNLIPGDTNDARDAFVKDRRTGQVTRVSVASDGTQQNDPGPYLAANLTEDGRYVVLSTRSTNLVPNDIALCMDPFTPTPPAYPCQDLFLHDRVTGHTMRATVPAAGGEANQDTYGGDFDGRFVVFGGAATNLAGTDSNGTQSDIFVYGPDTTDASAELSGDGRLDDTVLVVLDTTAGTPTPVALAPAEDVSVASDGAAAFLRPEEKNGFPLYADSFTCNADADFDDACAFLSVNGAAPTSLGREATAIAVTPDLVAALVPDGLGDTFLQVWDRPSGPWSGNLGPAADSFDVSGSTVAFRASGTGILHVYDHTTASWGSLGEPAEDFVAGAQIVAFRTEETTTDLNSDLDTQDYVIRVYDLVTDQLLETSQAVTPCRFEACDPRRPYRVSGDNVTFLTLEADQGGLDLDANGDANGIVIQTFNARKAAQALGGGGGFAAAAFSFSSGGSDEVITLAGVSAGVCTTTGEACSTDDDCGGAPRSCFLPPGGCIEDLGTACNVATGCPGNQFCVPTPGGAGAGICHLNHGPCGNDSDCSTFPSGAVCEDGDRDRVRLFAPLAADSDSGTQLLPGLETGEGTCASDADCAGDEFCSPTTDTCQPDEPELVTVGAPDTDADGVVDDLDNCPRQSNPDQADENANDVGDICDLLTLGPDCGNLVDDDGDGYVDTADPGCSGAGDPSELSALQCDDGQDNDNDGFTDFDPDPGEGDPHCFGPTDNKEKPNKRCGLGFELALGLWPLAWWQRRRARRGGSTTATLAAACLGRSCVLCIASFLGLALGLKPESARAICDVIPGVTAEFRGALGTLNRPFAIPGEVGQQLSVTLDPTECDAASPGFLDLPGGTLPEDDYFVTVLFEPPNGGTRNAVVLTTSGSLATCETRRTDALPLLGGGSATCRVVQPGTQELRLVNATTLEFRFPDTDAELAPDDDDRTFTGPATIAVTPISAALPFGLATARCAATAGLVACIDELYTKVCGTAAANVDPVFGHFTALPPPNDYKALCVTPDTECTGTATELHFTVDAAGNALLPVDWRGILLRPDGIPVPRLVRAATTFAGFAGGSPVKIPGRSFLASYAPSGRRVHPVFDPLSDPTSELTLFGSADAAVGVVRVARRAPDPASVNPLYRECAGGTNAGLPCVDPEDCPCGGVCGATTCRGGADAGQPCSNDLECTGGECGPALFDFADRLYSSVGPVVVSSADYDLAAEDPVPIEGLLETPTLFAFVALEAIATPPAPVCGGAGQDLNGDGDCKDAVLVLRDRRTGTITPIGTSANPGRAVTRVRQPPFGAPAVAVEADVAAFLESEPLQSNQDANADGDVFDSVLRVFRVSTECGGGLPSAQELTSGTPVAIDAEPVIDGRSFAISNGLVYARTSEAADSDQTTTIESVSSTGVPGNSGTTHGAIADDGGHVALVSIASNLEVLGRPCEQDGVARCGRHVFVHDRSTGATVHASVDSLGNPAQVNPPPDTSSQDASISSDGRFVVFDSASAIFGLSNPNGIYQVWLHDRDADEDGVFDCEGDAVCQAGEVATELVSDGLTPGVDAADSFCNPSQYSFDHCGSSYPSVSADGRFVAFGSAATNLVAGATPTDRQMYVRDRVLTTTVRVSVDAQFPPQPSNTMANYNCMSPDGRFVVFDGGGLDGNPMSGVFLRDRDADEDGVFDEQSEPGGVATERVSVASDGTINNENAYPSYLGRCISDDGRFVVFHSTATNLVAAGDTNGQPDIFLRDRVAGETTRLSQASDGTLGNASSNGSSDVAAISGDGRFVAFGSHATNLVSGDSNGRYDIFVVDRATGHVRIASIGADGAQADCGPAESCSSEKPTLTTDGSRVVFVTKSTMAVAPPAVDGLDYDVFVRGPANSAADRTGDGDIDDVVLEVFDTQSPSPQPVVLGAATAASVAGGSAAFLRPEAADGLSCNGDGDLEDACVYLSVSGAAAVALGREATAVAVSPDLVAALVPGAGGSFLQVWVRPAGPWSSDLGPAADSLRVSGSTVAFRAAATGALHVYDHATAAVTALGATAEDFVLGEQIVAFRTAETTVDLNADGDTFDDVLQVYDLISNQLVSTEQAVTPCRFEACDPRLPYRVSGDVVTFLTLEADQGAEDLDGNGDAMGIVIQAFNAREAVEAAGGGGSFASFAAGPGAPVGVTAFAGVSAGICTTTAEACATSADCGTGGTCFVPPGGCIRDLDTPCTCGQLSCSGCTAPEFCVPTLGSPGLATCHVKEGSCVDDTQCTAPAVCEDDPSLVDVGRLFGPLSSQSDGRQLFLGAAIESGGGVPCLSDSDCAAGEICSEAGTCEPDRPELVTAGAPDTDSDGVVDDFDNCPRQANADQADENANDVGDICDLLTLGPDCGNLVDDDGDGYVDTADPGCSGAGDPSELSALQCDDGQDNDNDGFTDFDPDPGEGDPHCFGPTDNKEKPNKRCGLGFELALGLWPLAWWQRRRARRGDEGRDYPSASR